MRLKMKGWVLGLSLGMAFSYFSSSALMAEEKAKEVSAVEEKKATEKSTSSQAPEGSPGAWGYEAEGQKVFDRDLPLNLQEQVYMVESEAFRNKEFIYKEHLFEKHVKELAAKSKESVEVVRNKLLEVPEPTEKELKEVYERNKAKLPQGYEASKGMLLDHLRSTAASQKKMELLSQLAADKKFKILGVAPKAPKHDINFPEAPKKGALQAKVTIVKFSDFYCGFCQKAADTLSALVKKHPKDLAVVYMPLAVTGKKADQLSKAAYCAHKQGKFWEFHDQAFELGGGKLTDESPQELAQKVKVDEKKFTSCLSEASTAAFIQMAKDEAKKLGVQSTPTMFINGVRAGPLMDLEKSLADAVEKAIKEASS